MIVGVPMPLVEKSIFSEKGQGLGLGYLPVVVPIRVPDTIDKYKTHKYVGAHSYAQLCYVNAPKVSGAICKGTRQHVQPSMD